MKCLGDTSFSNYGSIEHVSDIAKPATLTRSHDQQFTKFYRLAVARVHNTKKGLSIVVHAIAYATQ